MNRNIKLITGFLLLVCPALAGMTPTSTAHASVVVTPLVADQQGAAPNTDPNLVNSWGLSRDDEGLLWVTDNGTDLATSYDSNTGVPTGTAINIPMGAPTGNVYVSEGIDFQITENGNSGPAELLFDTRLRAGVTSLDALLRTFPSWKRSGSPMLRDVSSRITRSGQPCRSMRS